MNLLLLRDGGLLLPEENPWVQEVQENGSLDHIVMRLSGSDQVEIWVLHTNYEIFGSDPFSQKKHAISVQLDRGCLCRTQAASFAIPAKIVLNQFSSGLIRPLSILS